jgi:hypothetical protein
VWGSLRITDHNIPSHKGIRVKPEHSAYQDAKWGWGVHGEVGGEWGGRGYKERMWRMVGWDCKETGRD